MYRTITNRYTHLLPRARWSQLIFAVCLLLGVTLRVWDFHRTPGLFIDEAFNGTDALHALATGHFAAFYPSNHGREGMFINLQAGSIWVFRDMLHWSKWPEPWMLRAVSAVFGCLTLVAFYFFCRRLMGRREALLALFFLSTSCWHVLFSRIGFRAIAAPFFLALGLWLLLAAVAKVGRRRRTMWVLLALAGAVFGLGFQTYIAFRLMPALALVVLVFALDRETLARRAAYALLFVVGFTASAFPLLHYYAGHSADFTGRMNQVAVWTSPSPFGALLWSALKTVQMCFVYGDFNWRHNVSQSSQLSWVAGLCVIAGVLRLAADGRRHGFRRQRGILLMGLLLTAALPAIVGSEGAPHALRAMQMLIPVSVAGGVGGTLIYRFLRRRLGRRTARMLAMLLLAISFATDVTRYFRTWLNAPEVALAFRASTVQAGYRLRTIDPALPKIVVVPNELEEERRPVMFVADLPTEASLDERHVRFTNDSAAASHTAGAVVLDATR